MIFFNINNFLLKYILFIYLLFLKNFSNTSYTGISCKSVFLNLLLQLAIYETTESMKHNKNLFYNIGGDLICQYTFLVQGAKVLL